MAYNKFITQDGVVALDLTEDTITAETLEKGITAHDKHGMLIVGTMESEEVAEYDGSVVIEFTVKLITFTIEGTEYQAEEGMTWKQWITSDYNTGNYQDNGYNVVKNNDYSKSVSNSSGTSVHPNDAIISGHSYSMASTGEPV